MAKTRMINTRFWDDTYISNLDPVEKLLFLYMLTNPATNISGIYELPLKNIAMDTGLDKEMVLKILDRFASEGKVYFTEGWVCLKNFLKHQNIRSEKVQIGVHSELSNVPKEILTKYIGYGYGIDTQQYLNLNLYLNPDLNLEPQAEPTKIGSEDMRLTELLIGLIQTNNPDWKMKGSKETWAEHINKLNRIDERTHEQIEFMIRWTQRDSFWQQNILSTAKLRAKFNDLIPKVKASFNKNSSKGKAIAL